MASGGGDIENGGQQGEDSVLCVAVVRNGGSEVVLFDAKGDPRTFTCEGDAGKLCFSGHGHDADDFLTPCFDEDGHHGDPEEGCFCGIDTPHIHAHAHDPNTCDAEETGCGKKKGNPETELMKLAKLTLHPTEEDFPGEAEVVPLLHFAVSDQMPKECNGHKLDGHPESNKATKRRMHKVQHDDHEDYLVLDEKTGNLHLEHPHEDCGKDDVHGRFQLVGKRKLAAAASGSDVRVHFFQAAPKKFSLLEFIGDHFETDPGLVAAIRPVETKKSCCSGGVCSAAKPPPKPICCGDESSRAAVPSCCSTGTCTFAPFMPPELLDPLPEGGDSKTVRSTIVCTQICCSSEIPGINRITESLEGISKTMINVPLKQVTLDHDPTVITAKDIEDALNKGHFGATVKRDGGVGVSSGGGTGRSHFHVQKICCASEIPAINKILEPIEGVSNVSINVTAKMVYVDHNTGTVSAQALCDALNKAAFGATVKKDAGEMVKGAIPAYVTSTLKVDDGNPDTESIKAALSGYKPSQLESFVVDAPSKLITVKHNPLLLPLPEIVVSLEEDAGMKTTIETNGADNVDWDIPAYTQAAGQDVGSGEDHTWPKPTVMLAGLFWVVSMLSFIGGNWEYLKYVALLAVAFGIPGIAIKAVATMRRLMFDTNCLMLFAAIGAVALQEYTEAAAVTFLFALSEWLEVRATTRARNALSAIVNLRPEFAFMVHPSTKEQMMVPASAVPVGAVVAVKTGDRIPCDGVVVEGQSTVDESSLTGESRPVRKGPKDVVSGGTINCGSTHLMIQTTSTADNSAISRLVGLVEEAQANRSETEKIVDEFAKVYTPIVVLAALCMCTIPWAFGTDTGKEWTHNGLVLIVVACPCALIISTPVTYVAGLAATAQRGVLIKGGAHLEALGLTKTICFDKTGTLTQGSFALISINTIGTTYERKEVLEYLVLMEERANHPLALAIVDGTRNNEGIVSPKNKKVQDHTFMAGEGLSGRIDGKQIYVGNERLFKRLGLHTTLSEEMQNMVANWEAMAGTVGFMSIEGAGIVCAYCVADASRPESMEVVEALGKLDIDVYMLTGDNKDAAKAVGNLVGLKPESINSELLPEEKLSFIKTLKKEQTGRSILSNPLSRRELVCHVGDGVNDAPALAAADIGVAMGVGAALAMETADVTLLDSNLKKLLYSINMGRRVIWKIKENVAFSLIIKVVVLGFTIAGKVALWAAIVSDVGAMICVTLNGMRLLPSSKIDREKMGDVENVTYHSQENGTFHSRVTDVSQHAKDMDVENIVIEIGSNDGGHDHGHNHSHSSAHDHSHGHSHGHAAGDSHEDAASERDDHDDGGHSHSHGHTAGDAGHGHASEAASHGRSCDYHAGDHNHQSHDHSTGHNGHEHSHEHDAGEHDHHPGQDPENAKTHIHGHSEAGDGHSHSHGHSHNHKD